MHEASIAQNLLEIALEKAQEHQASKITLVRIRVGELAGVNQEALRFAWENLRDQTIAKEASLEVISSPLLAKCQNCKKVSEIKGEVFKCGKCGSSEIEIVSGLELYIQDLEIE